MGGAGPRAGVASLSDRAVLSVHEQHEQARTGRVVAAPNAHSKRRPGYLSLQPRRSCLFVSFVGPLAAPAAHPKLGGVSTSLGRVLVIAGSDSGGGAGVQADIKTVTALGGYAATAITAVTVQDTLGVHGVHPIPPDVIAAQIRVVLADIGADAIKTGMLGDAAAVEAVLAALAGWPDIPLVVDPVMVAKGGASLIAPDALAPLRRLIRRAALVTPNAPEAEALTGIAVATTDDLRRAGEALLTSGVRAVLMKGGHVPGESVIDLLMSPTGETVLEGPRIATRHTHGTGCTLASACATGLAQGLKLELAVARAWAYVAEAIRRAPGLGAGAGPIDHAWPMRP
jgi:hydroxymethylpyrimidine/phosphomethylpyrimidine kinase